jgi:hypothetical protein
MPARGGHRYQGVADTFVQLLAPRRTSSVVADGESSRTRGIAMTPTRESAWVGARSALESLAARVRAEYHEMPGLSLTAAQASRLLGIDHGLCLRVLQTLVSDGALYHTPRGAYVASPPIRHRP